MAVEPTVGQTAAARLIMAEGLWITAFCVALGLGWVRVGVGCCHLADALVPRQSTPKAVFCGVGWLGRAMAWPGRKVVLLSQVCCGLSLLGLLAVAFAQPVLLSMVASPRTTALRRVPSNAQSSVFSCFWSGGWFVAGG